MNDKEDFGKVTAEEMKSLLEKSGYLFEQQIGSRIERLGYQTETNKAFLDVDESKSREIDVFARKAFMYRQEKSIIGFCYINCECKNSKNPYIFIKRNKGALDREYIPDGLKFPSENISIYVNDEKNAHKHIPTFEYLKLSRYHFACISKQKAVQICKLVRNQKNMEMQHSGVIESFIYPLIKSKLAFEKKFVGSNSIQQKVHLFFNIAVVSSKLYTIDSEVEDSLPVEVPYVPFIRDIQTNTVKGNHLITFVNQEYLEEFISKEVESFCGIVKKIMLDNSELFTATSHGSNPNWKVHTEEEAKLK